MADDNDDTVHLLSEEDSLTPTAPNIQTDSTENIAPPPITSTQTFRDNNGSPPPPYGDAPPPYIAMNLPSTQPPPVGVMGEPTVVCRVCQQLVFIRGREGQRVVKCSNCHEATPIKAPPAGKKYIRCPCNALLTCRATSTRISCPRANCKRVINVGGGPPSSATVPIVPGAGGDVRIRVTCGHCNETFVFRTTAHLARCPYCRKISSVGNHYAKNRALIFAIIGIIFLAIGIGVTVGTYELAKGSGGIYVVWFGAYIIGLLNLIRSCYYCTMTVSQVEGASP